MNQEIERKDKHSTFFVTINPNQVPTDITHAEFLATELNSALTKLFNEDTLRDYILKFKIPGDNWDENIYKVDISYAIELGKHKKGRRVHNHVIINVDHNSLIFLDRHAIVGLISDEMGLDNVYLNITAANSKRTLEEYIEKDSLIDDF